MSTLIPRDRPADEIEVTEEMIRAGAKVARSFDSRVADCVDLAVWIYQAMEAARHKPKSNSS